MKPVTRASLIDVLDSCRFIMETCKTRSFDDYQSDRLFRRAMEREFEIIGEGLKRIRDSEPELFDDIESGKSIVGFRNRLAHGYDAIDDAIVWGIIEGHLHKLISEIEQKLNIY